jgi:hypothetical protein
VEEGIKAAHADLDVETDRRGSASYERRVAQRQQDLADIAALKETEKRKSPDELHKGINDLQDTVATPAGLEPATLGLGIRCSIR